MQKKILLLLPIEPLQSDLQLENESVQLIKYASGKEYEESRDNYIYSIHLDNSTNEQVLIFDMYKPSGEHLWRYFLNKNGQYFTIRKDRENKVSNAGLDYILKYNWNAIYHMANDRTLSATQDFFKDRKIIDPLKYISGKNQKYKTKKKEARLNKIRESLDNAMLEIRPLPMSVERWAENTLLKSSRYVFYKYSKHANTIGYCTHCKTNIVVSGAKNNKAGRCSHCKSHITFKAVDKFLRSRGFSDSKNFAYFQTTKKGLCVRVFNATRYFSSSHDKYKNSHVEYHESYRAFYNMELTGYELLQAYNYEKFMNAYEYRFVKTYDRKNPKCLVYPTNLNKLLKYDNRRKHIDFNAIARLCGELNPFNLIDFPVGYNVVENTFKSGLYNIVKGIINNTISGYNYNLTATNIKDGFGITKSDINDLQKINPTIEQLRMYQIIKNKEHHINIDVFNELSSWNISSNSISTMLKHTTVHNMVKYIKQQRKNFENPQYRWTNTENAILRDWLDYIENAILLEFDLKKHIVKFPRDLKQAHDDADVTAQSFLKNGVQIPVIEKMQKSLDERFYFATKKLLIRAPKSHADIINEANKLDHCVWRYAKDMAVGNTIILFIRKTSNPEQPYFTLELNPDTLQIEQCKGYSNCHYNEDVERFIEKWKETKLSNKDISA